MTDHADVQVDIQAIEAENGDATVVVRVSGISWDQATLIVERLTEPMRKVVHSLKENGDPLVAGK